MTDVPEDQQQDQDDAPKAGERLAAARRAQNISVLEIAKELHLDEHKIRALEANSFADLGAPVFAKGHLRKYAELVNVPIDDVLADYYKLVRAQPAPPVVGPRRKQPREVQLGPWLAGIVVVAVVGAAGYWWTGRPTPGPRSTDAATATRTLPVGSPAAEAGSPADEPVTAAEAPAGSDGPEAGVETETEAGTSPPAAAGEATAAAPTAEEADAVAATPSGPGLRLTLEFAGDCWTEVTDADGARLFFDLGTAGRRVSLSGAPPLRVLVGNSDNVTISVDGEPYAIPDSARRGLTARLTIRSR